MFTTLKFRANLVEMCLIQLHNGYKFGIVLS